MGRIIKILVIILLSSTELPKFLRSFRKPKDEEHPLP